MRSARRSPLSSAKLLGRCRPSRHAPGQREPGGGTVRRRPSPLRVGPRHDRSSSRSSTRANSPPGTTTGDSRFRWLTGRSSSARSTTCDIAGPTEPSSRFAWCRGRTRLFRSTISGPTCCSFCVPTPTSSSGLPTTAALVRPTRSGAGPYRDAVPTFQQGPGREIRPSHEPFAHLVPGRFREPQRPRTRSSRRRSRFVGRPAAGSRTNATGPTSSGGAAGVWST